VAGSLQTVEMMVSNVYDIPFFYDIKIKLAPGGAVLEAGVLG